MFKLACLVTVPITITAFVLPALVATRAIKPSLVTRRPLYPSPDPSQNDLRPAPGPRQRVICTYSDDPGAYIEACEQENLALAARALEATAEAARAEEARARKAQARAESRRVPKAERHSRKCAICHQPDREATDQSYIHWVSSSYIVHEYKLSSQVALHRHAVATGLYGRRRGNVQHALDRIIEQAGDSRPTADAVIRAIRATSLLTEDGRWAEPPRRLVVEHYAFAAAPPHASLPDSSSPRTV